MHRFEYGNCPVKGQVRALALSVGWNKSEPAKSYLCLPARDCLCIKTALTLSVIDTNTEIFFAERDRQDYNTILQTLKDLGFTKVTGHYGKIENWKLRPKNKIELAFLDFCGEYTPQVARWLQWCRNFVFSPNAIVSITTQANGRY